MIILKDLKDGDMIRYLGGNPFNSDITPKGVYKVFVDNISGAYILDNNRSLRKLHMQVPFYWELLESPKTKPPYKDMHVKCDNACDSRDLHNHLVELGYRSEYARSDFSLDFFTNADGIFKPNSESKNIPIYKCNIVKNISLEKFVEDVIKFDGKTFNKSEFMSAIEKINEIKVKS